MSFFFSLICLVIILYISSKKAPEPPSNTVEIIEVLANKLNSQLEQVKNISNKLPETILNSLTGTINTNKGKIGELIGFLTLKAKYDRIIPLNNISDFIGIKFPVGDTPGTIDFIDIKTGSASKLTKDQRILKELVTKKLIAFKTIKIEELDGFLNEEETTSSDSSNNSK